MTKPLIAAIESGGTKFNLSVGYDVNKPLRTLRISTDSPKHTLAQCARFFREAEADFGSLSALGIATFGPVSLDPQLNHYGSLLNTPKTE